MKKLEKLKGEFFLLISIISSKSKRTDATLPKRSMAKLTSLFSHPTLYLLLFFHRYIPDDSIEEGGHRSINRQIEKNRGLTPRRPKAVRNPRVKKRQKFDKATKKLGSVRAVFKGGQSSLQGGYEGEKSGISSHLVKSRSFGK